VDLVLKLAHAAAQAVYLLVALHGALAHVQDPHHAGEVDALVRQLADEVQPLDVALRVQARVAARAPGRH
jgi:hypothetical protein